MDETEDNASQAAAKIQNPLRPEVLTILTTEHYNLQSGQSGTISEAIGRSSLYLGSVSSSPKASLNEKLSTRVRVSRNTLFN